MRLLRTCRRRVVTSKKGREKLKTWNDGVSVVCLACTDGNRKQKETEQKTRENKTKKEQKQKQNKKKQNKTRKNKTKQRKRQKTEAASSLFLGRLWHSYYIHGFIYFCFLLNSQSSLLTRRSRYLFYKKEKRRRANSYF